MNTSQTALLNSPNLENNVLSEKDGDGEQKNNLDSLPDYEESKTPFSQTAIDYVCF